MEKNPVLSSLRKYSSFLREADIELSRPEEDAVILCSCTLSKSAVMGYLKAFLYEKKADYSSASIESLLSSCRQLDPGFNNIELNAFDCRSERPGDSYCLEGDKVRECFKQAKKVEAFVLSRLIVQQDLL